MDITLVEVVLVVVIAAIAFVGFRVWKQHKVAEAAKAALPADTPAADVPTTDPIQILKNMAGADVARFFPKFAPVVPVPVVLPEVVPASVPPPVWPKLIQRGRVFYRAVADLNANFKPPVSAGIVNGAYVGLEGCVLNEPSNAPAGFSSRSPTGYPLFYALDAESKPVGAPVVIDGDEHFNSDTEIAPFWAAATALNAKNAAITEAAEAARQAIRYTASLVATELTPSECGWFYKSVLNNGSDAVKQFTSVTSGTDDELRMVLIVGRENAGSAEASRRMLDALLPPQ